MRVAVLFFSQERREQLLTLAKGLMKGIEKQGVQVDLIDAFKDYNSKLTIYEYIAVGTDFSGFISGKIPRRVTEFLSSAGMVSGKRCFAFVPKKTFGSGKGLTNLMKAMEAEGMYLKNSGILNSEAEAIAIGERLHVSRA